MGLSLRCKLRLVLKLSILCFIRLLIHSFILACHKEENQVVCRPVLKRMLDTGAAIVLRMIYPSVEWTASGIIPELNAVTRRDYRGDLRAVARFLAITAPSAMGSVYTEPGKREPHRQ